LPDGVVICCGQCVSRLGGILKSNAVECCLWATLNALVGRCISLWFPISTNRPHGVVVKGGCVVVSPRESPRYSSSCAVVSLRQSPCSEFNPVTNISFCSFFLSLFLPSRRFNASRSRSLSSLIHIFF